MMIQGFLRRQQLRGKGVGGNPAAVFLDGEGLGGAVMQSIARQMNLVETVFVFRPGEKEKDFRFRYFTPTEELPVAGHPTIAAVLALIEAGEIDPAEDPSFCVNTSAGRQAVTVRAGDAGPIVFMEQPEPRFLPHFQHRGDVARVLGLSADDLLPGLPVQPVDTGLGHLIVPVKSLDALRRAQRSAELSRLCQSAGVREVQAFAFGAYEQGNDLHTRNICPREGIEDPACGVGNGALGAYLLKNRYPDATGFELRVEQGDIVNMPSVVTIRADRIGDSLRVAVGGLGRVMIKGRFFVPETYITQ